MNRDWPGTIYVQREEQADRILVRDSRDMHYAAWICSTTDNCINNSRSSSSSCRIPGSRRSGFVSTPTWWLASRCFPRMDSAGISLTYTRKMESPRLFSPRQPNHDCLGYLSYALTRQLTQSPTTRSWGVGVLITTAPTCKSLARQCRLSLLLCSV